jgi:hypothetical protein
MSKARTTTNVFSTFGGRAQCVQCQATSKRTGQQCRAPAIKGRYVWRLHGGCSTGPETPEGRQRCASASYVHGRETRAIRERRQERLINLDELEALGCASEIITGSKTRG